ncbi:hypothetical protein SAMD00019534_068810, partial [Acytostelium subglobosum LB1]|uniref:hypothetical protein n=1 Tax=Acytostelium subglobosum LB1 TaxID=1410327 RepID=UPI000644C447
MSIRVLVTGASGLLGRAYCRVLMSEQYKNQFELLGLAYSRYDLYKDTYPLAKVNMDDKEHLKATVTAFKPNVIIHCAAERRPDVCENDKDRVIKLNVLSTEYLSDLAKQLNAYLFLISSDYVFDGKHPPYYPDSVTNPLSFYGETKKESEIVATRSNSRNVILRVPVLYGQVETLGESAVTVVAEQLLKNPNNDVDNWQIRYPTLVDDVAKCSIMLIQKKTQDDQLVKGVIQFTGTQRKTKYDMAVDMSKLLNIDPASIKAANHPPSGAPRPHNAQLDLTATKNILDGQQLPDTPFDTEIVKVIQPFVKQ